MNLNIDYDTLFAYRFSLQEDYQLEDEKEIIMKLKYYLIESGFPITNIPNILKEFYEKFGINISLEIITEALHENSFVNFMTNTMALPIFNELMNAIGINNEENQEHDTEENQEHDTEENQEHNNEANQEHDTEENQEHNNEANQDNEENDNDEDTHDMPPLISINSNLQLAINIGGQEIIYPVNNLLQLNNLIPLQNDNVVCTLQDDDFNKLNTFTTLVKLKDKCAICMTHMEEKEVICELPCNDKFHLDCITPLLKKYSYNCPNCRKEVGKPKYNNM